MLLRGEQPLVGSADSDTDPADEPFVIVVRALDVDVDGDEGIGAGREVTQVVD